MKNTSENVAKGQQQPQSTAPPPPPPNAWTQQAWNKPQAESSSSTTAPTATPPPNAWKQPVTSASATATAQPAEPSSPQQTPPAKPSADPVAPSIEAAMEQMNVAETAASPPSGPKSWADIARPEGVVEEAVAPAESTTAKEGAAGDEDTEKNVDEQQQNSANRSRAGANQRGRGRGGGQGAKRGGRGGGLSNRGRLNPSEMAMQAQQMVTAQQIAVQAVQLGMDPTIYQAQMAAMYGFPPELSMGFGQYGPGGSQDDKAYPSIALFTMYPHLALVNQTTIDPRLAAEAQYFVVRVKSEQDMHRHAKYCVWVGKEDQVQELNTSFMNAGIAGTPMRRRIFLIFFIESTQNVAGMAEMVSMVMPSQHQPGGVQFHVQWVFVKDVPGASFQECLPLQPPQKQQGEDAPPTVLPTFQEVENNQGLQALQAIVDCPLSTSVLMNFKYFDQAESQGAVVQDNVQRHGSYSGGRNRAMGGGRGRNQRGGNWRRDGNDDSGSPANGRSSRGGRGSRGGGKNARGGRGGRDNASGGFASGGGSNFKSSSEQELRREVLSSDGGRQQLAGEYQFEIQHKTKNKKKKKDEGAPAEETTN